MENEILFYCLKVSLALMLFYALYKLCLDKDTFFRIKRSYFLFAIIVSVAYPFITFNFDKPFQYEIPDVIKTTTWIFADTSEIAASQTGSSFSLTYITLTTLCIGALFLFVQFISHIWMVVKLIRNNKSSKTNGYYLIELDNNLLPPFSFFNLIFVNAQEDAQSQEKIIIHEMAHVRQYHSIDILLMEIICILFWWNPFAWLLKKEMKINLEYLADKAVMEKGYNKKSYQYLLLNSSIGNTGISIINNFNVSQLKKRIIMMNKKQTSIRMSVKYLLAIPLLAMLLIFNNAQASDYANMITTENNTHADQPQFPGGEQAMFKFISQNMRYPTKAHEKKVTGVVKVSYVITKAGKVSDIKIKQGLEACDEEVVRVLKLMPDWTSSDKSSQKELSVKFILERDNSKIDASPNEDGNIVVVGYSK